MSTGPIALRRAAAGRPETFSEAPGSERPSRVLLVVAEQEHRSALSVLLEEEGYEVLRLSDADEVMRVTAEFEPDLVILALELPGASGLGLCGELAGEKARDRTSRAAGAASRGHAGVAAGRQPRRQSRRAGWIDRRRSADRRAFSLGSEQRDLFPWLAYLLDSAYMCGLLHDIGEARIYRIFEDLKPPPEAEAEIPELVHKYHCFAGAEIATTWQLPSEIVDACALHHQNEPAGAHVRIVRIADALVGALDGELDLERCAELGLDETTARKLYETVKGELATERGN